MTDIINVHFNPYAVSQFARNYGDRVIFSVDRDQPTIKFTKSYEGSDCLQLFEYVGKGNTTLRLTVDQDWLTKQKLQAHSRYTFQQTTDPTVFNLVYHSAIVDGERKVLKQPAITIS